MTAFFYLCWKNSSTPFCIQFWLRGYLRLKNRPGQQIKACENIAIMYFTSFPFLQKHSFWSMQTWLYFCSTKVNWNGSATWVVWCCTSTKAQMSRLNCSHYALAFCGYSGNWRHNSGNWPWPMTISHVPKKMDAIFWKCSNNPFHTLPKSLKSPFTFTLIIYTVWLGGPNRQTHIEPNIALHGRVVLCS